MRVIELEKQKRWHYQIWIQLPQFLHNFRAPVSDPRIAPLQFIRFTFAHKPLTRASELDFFIFCVALGLVKFEYETKV